MKVKNEEEKQKLKASINTEKKLTEEVITQILNKPVDFNYINKYLSLKKKTGCEENLSNNAREEIKARQQQSHIRVKTAWKKTNKRLQLDLHKERETNFKLTQEIQQIKDELDKKEQDIKLLKQHLNQNNCK